MNLEKIRNLRPASVEQDFKARDAIVYALGLGYGTDPLDESELPFVYEAGLKTVPSVCSVLCHPGFWLQDPQYEVNWIRLLHAEQDFTILRPIPATGHFHAEHEILGIQDRGRDKGAMLCVQKTLYESSRSDALATVRSSILLRGDGGQGGFGSVGEAPGALPKRDPERVVEISTLPSAALIYRLSGDWNPLHIDPAIARKAGFERPILHGLCTQGIACRALLRTYCGNDPTRLQSLFTRFSAPVYPGETIRFEFHEIDECIRFKAIVKERAVVVLDRCSATLQR